MSSRVASGRARQISLSRCSRWGECMSCLRLLLCTNKPLPSRRWLKLKEERLDLERVEIESHTIFVDLQGPPRLLQQIGLACARDPGVQRKQFLRGSLAGRLVDSQG